MEMSSILSFIEMAMQAIGKLAFILICFYYGKIAANGWRGRKSIIIKIALIIILGLTSFFGGLIAKEYLGFDFPLSDYLSSLAIAFACFVILSFISTIFEVKNKYATKMDITAITNDLKNLKIEVAKITKALDDKNIKPKEMDEEDIKDKIKEGLEKKGIKKVSVSSLTKHADYWIAKLSNGKEAIIDAYTGSLTEIIEPKTPFKILYKKPLFFVGLIFAIALFSFFFTNLTQSTINAINDAFDFSFLFEKILPPGCIKASMLLESLNESSIMQDSGINITKINKTIFEETQTFIVPEMSRRASHEGIDFIISASYAESGANIGAEMASNPIDNIYKVRICVFKANYELCECIGEKQTDPLFTAPYLIKLGIISEAIKSLIFSGLSGILGV
ncbi:MAG: hypothetical protein PHT91_03545 [Candidatus Nanoarchaeia archaeon]|nr:hypothetical protein [Candidatus Nanoarchaeia archaeon]